MAFSHTAVLVREVTELLRPGQARCVVDCTAGLGGHCEALLRLASPETQLLALDLDAGNLARAKAHLEQSFPGRAMRFFHASFADLPEVLKEANVAQVDALLADLGISSSQLDDPQRGLSFLADGPLDMRLDVERPTTAADLVNRLSEQALADLLYRNADEHRSRRIARAIVEARKAGRIERTGELAQIVERAVGGRHGEKIHPATKAFQALRIAVNGELEALDSLLGALPKVLSVGGRACIISFHSLEDRRVKQAFATMKSVGTGRIVTPKPVIADDEEVAFNPRSRSAKLRCVERMA